MLSSVQHDVIEGEADRESNSVLSPPFTSVEKNLRCLQAEVGGLRKRRRSASNYAREWSEWSSGGGSVCNKTSRQDVFCADAVVNQVPSSDC